MSHMLMYPFRLMHSIPAIVMRSGSWGIADQALISATNFCVMLLVARDIGPSAFGMFVVAYTVLLFANSVQAALFTQPHNVLGSRRQGRDFAAFTTATGIGQAVFACGASVSIAAAGIVMIAAGVETGWTIILLGPTCFAWQLQEFVRRVLYTQSDYQSAFVNDVMTYGGQLAVITLMWRGGHLSAETAIGAIGIAAGFGGLLGMWQLRKLYIPKLDHGTIRRYLAENWDFSRWLLGGSLTAWTSSQLYPILTAGLVSAAAAGGLRATLNLVAPTHIILKSMESMLPSRSANAYHLTGLSGLRDKVFGFAVPAGLAIAGYCLVVSSFAKPVLGWLFGSTYEAYWWLVPLMAIVYVLAFSSTVASILLSSINKTSPMFYANAISAALVLTLGIWSVSQYGLVAAAAGMIAHGLILNLVLWQFVRLEMR